MHTIPVLLGHSRDYILTLGSSQHPVTSFSMLYHEYPWTSSFWMKIIILTGKKWEFISLCR